MNLQRDEYVSNFASGYGVRIVFHEPGTFPLPSSEGITLSPGTDNNVALKTVSIFESRYLELGYFEFCEIRSVHLNQN